MKNTKIAPLFCSHKPTKIKAKGGMRYEKIILIIFMAMISSFSYYGAVNEKGRESS